MEERKKTSLLRILIISAITIALWFILVSNNVVNGPSMKKTLYSGDRVIGLKVAYLFSSPKRGDIITAADPDDKSISICKRVIGVPGDTVLIKDNELYINGELIEEEYDIVKEYALKEFGPYEVPEGKYFVLGDNRINSQDSRYFKNTFVDEDDITAKLYFRLFPDFKWLY